jgi:probable rRNA maturation factor
MDPLVEVIVEGGDWSAFGDVEALADRAAAAALARAGVTADRVGISLMLADDAAVADLNARFRGKAGPTNVLSWPAFQLAPAAPGSPPPAPPLASSGRTPLGDVALAAGVVVQESLERKLAPEAHLTHLIVHGVLHLLGYDHETDADASLMEGLERLALDDLGLADPYA